MGEKRQVHQLVVRVPADMKAELERDAEANGRTVAQSVRFILREHLAERSEAVHKSVH